MTDIETRNLRGLANQAKMLGVLERIKKGRPHSLRGWGVLIAMSRGVAMLKELEYKINSTIID